MVKTEQLQHPKGDHHFGFTNNRLVCNFSNIYIFSGIQALNRTAELFVCIFY